MRLSALQFSFAVSVAVHAAAIGVCAWTGSIGISSQPALETDHKPFTLFLVAAPATASNPSPASAPAKLPSPVAPSIPIPPVQELMPPTTEALPETPSVPEAGPSPTILSAAPTTNPTPPANPTTYSVGGRGDGSSLQPGNDSTSSGVPAVLARPRYGHNREPSYPIQARRRRLEGEVVLEVRVSPQGRVSEIRVRESSGHAVLDEAALRTVRKWEFEPARLGLEAIESQVEVPVRFTLSR